MFDHSYASGSPDSGFYIGQCNPCHAVITDVVAEYNQLGYSGTNAAGDLFIVRSVWRNNRTGIVPNSFDGEELAPQGEAVIAGNLVETNGRRRRGAGRRRSGTSSTASASCIVGGIDNQIIRNHLPGNTLIGIAIVPNPGLGGGTSPSGATSIPATGNVVRGNNVHGSSLTDLATRAGHARRSQLLRRQRRSARRRRRTSSRSCRAKAPVPATPAPAPSTSTGSSTPSKNPAGRDYEDTPVPPKQRNMANPSKAKARAAGTPPTVDLDSITRPS